jgi:hypothetical protein
MAVITLTCAKRSYYIRYYYVANKPIYLSSKVIERRNEQNGSDCLKRKATLTLDAGSDPIRLGPTDQTVGRKTNTQSCIRALTLQPTRLVWST